MQQLGPEGARLWRLGAQLGAVGLEMAIAVMLATWAGGRLDAWLDVSPYGALSGFCIGIAAAALGLWRAIKAAQRHLQP